MRWYAARGQRCNPLRVYEALRSLAPLLGDSEPDGEAHYLTAYCLHSMAHGHKPTLSRALIHYSSALERGFDRFWTLYHRGVLHATLGQEAEAITDLKAALW